jgi:hypothetical protein
MRPFVPIYLALGLFLVSQCPAQTDSAQHADTLPLKVLIAMGPSYLENAVSAIVKDSLQARGYEVTIVSNSVLGSQDRHRYRAFILFSAVRESKLTRTAQRLMRSQEGPGEASNMLVCDVLGEPWKGGHEEVSGVASATKRVKPEDIAARVVANFDSIFVKK